MKLWPGCNCCEETSESYTPCGCADGLPKAWKVTFGGLVDALCPGCDAYNVLEYTLSSKVGDCAWYFTPAGVACLGITVDTISLVISPLAGGYRITCTLAIYNPFTGFFNYTVWRQDFVGTDCMIPSEMLPLLSDDNVVCDNSASTCHIMAVP